MRDENLIFLIYQFSFYGGGDFYDRSDNNCIIYRFYIINISMDNLAAGKKQQKKGSS